MMSLEGTGCPPCRRSLRKELLCIRVSCGPRQRLGEKPRIRVKNCSSPDRPLRACMFMYIGARQTDRLAESGRERERDRDRKSAASHYEQASMLVHCRTSTTSRMSDARRSLARCWRKGHHIVGARSHTKLRRD